MPLQAGSDRATISHNIHEMILSGHPHAQAVAASLRNAHYVRRDSGGMVDPTSASIGGMTPSVQSMNPNVRSMVQRYSALPVEKLQEMAAAMGGTPQAQIIQSVLRQKMAMPAAAQPMQPAQAAAHGGGIRALASGGMGGISVSQGDPWWTRQEAYSADRPATGFLNGATPGRADSIKTTAPSGSYVLPADVIAGLGEGNSLAGARVVQEMLSSGPHGIPQQRMGRGSGPPRAPSPYTPRLYEAKGGGVQRGSGVTPVALSHGEFVVTAEQVARIGGGDLKRGHRILDAFVLHVRKKHIKKLESLPGPVKS